MALSPDDTARLAHNLEAVRARISRACAACGREPASVQLVAVTKYAHAPYAQALLELGQLDLGENRVQHLLEVDAKLTGVRPRWHLIGHLQKNKVKAVAGRLHTLHTLDGTVLAEKLNAAREGLAPLRVYLQLKLAESEGRAGVAEEELGPLWQRASDLTGLEPLGLMGLPPRGAPEEARPHFRRLREAAGRLGAQQLSMGMTADLEVAVAEGATVVRVGSALLEGLSDDARLP
jgi:PLP dependent protein